MSVYILHLDSPLKHARHYVGFASKVNRRLEHHRSGSGARFTQVCNENGITYQLARVFEQADRAFERKLKNCKHTARYCPICAGEKARAYKPKG
ncbi:MAG: GIY-YIG nuclease family protein [Chloroflexi bacterium]|nr:GIY-YIG nuclease family protein [Chloroflexota bacterium]